MTINKLSVYCKVDGAYSDMAFYPPVQQFSSSAADELFVVDIVGSSSGDGNSVWSLDGTEYMTFNCNPSMKIW